MAATTRTSTGKARSAPTGTTCLSCRTRKSLAWADSGMSPISSRNNVPSCAAAIRPSRATTAPVNAPRVWPNSSASINDSGMAAQLSGTNGPCRRAEPSWTARAMSSLPVPVSPVMSTVDVVSPMLRMVSITETSRASSPRSSGAYSRRQARSSFEVGPRFANSSSRRSSSNGLRITSENPARIASMMRVGPVSPVMHRTSEARLCWIAHRARSAPVPSGRP